MPGQEPELTALQKIENKLNALPQRMADPEFPAGLLPDLVRTANSRGSSLVMGAYAPLDPEDVANASAAAASADAATSGNPPDDYLAERLERFAQDLVDGGQSRLKQRDREQARAQNAIMERRLEDIQRIRGIDRTDPGAGAPEDGAFDGKSSGMKVWHGPSKRKGKGAGTDGGVFAGGGEHRGLGVAREEEEAAKGDAFAEFRKKRSGNYHSMIQAGRSLH